MRFARRLISLALALGAILSGPLVAQECTAAVIAPAMGEGSRPMLWKNRDTGELSNRVVYVKDQPHSYLALVDAGDPSGRIAWAGMNDAGFAIMNTASYNLPQKKGESVDQEGLIMALALRTCATVEDFEALLKANRGENLGVSANFGVIDARGKAWLLEAHNHGFERQDAAAVPEQFLLVTNFSRSGKKDAGAGLLRLDRASALAAGRRGPFTAQEILRDFARDTGHTLLRTPSWPAFKNLDAGAPWIHTRHTINRWDTATAVVLVGGSASARPVMWILPGEPLVSTALPVWVDAGAVPEPFWKGAEAPLWAETLRLKARVRPFYGIPEKQEYLDPTRLDNRAGTGILPALLGREAQTFDRVKAFLAVPRSPEALRAFQAELAEGALTTFRALK